MANHKKGRLPESDERETPPELFARLHEQHRFTLDAAAAPDNAKLPRYNCKDGGFRHTWKGERVWLNCPYSDIGTWVAQAWTSEAELVYMLLPNWTDRKWWLELVEPYRDLRTGDANLETGFFLRTEFLGRQRFLYKGLPILDERGRLGSPEFGLVGLLFTRKG